MARPRPGAGCEQEAADAGRGELLGLLVVDADDDQLLGSDGDRPPGPIEERRCELGYWLAREARGRGVATRAVRMLSAWAFENLPADRIEIHASRRTPRRGGSPSESDSRSRACFAPTS